MKSIDELKDKEGRLEETAIKQIIPYERPFLMIDTVEELTKKKVVATKKVTGDEDYLKGHFVGFPIMPGALIVEGLGQAGTLLVRYNLKDHEEKEILAYEFKKAKFQKPTLPGDTLRYELELKNTRKKDGEIRLATIRAKAWNAQDLEGLAFGTLLS
jgi:3-hydroxymyristoyl/3-hydroxydecanoyl-(acyl carrier protein) dehydratase